MGALQEVGQWLKQNWLALLSFLLSAFAVVLSYRKFTHDTRPTLLLRTSSGGNEIENVGQAVAVNIKLTLVERVKRPSGTLVAPDTLRPGERSIISALDWPEALTADLNQETLEPMSEWVLRMDGRKVHPNGARVAAYLLARERIIVILRYGAGDGPTMFVRLFSRAKMNPRKFPQLVPVPRPMRNRLCAFLIERFYGKNAELAPPFEFPPPSGGADERNVDDGT
jgi:hypothetical protein